MGVYDVGLVICVNGISVDFFVKFGCVYGDFFFGLVELVSYEVDSIFCVVFESGMSYEVY